MINWAVGMFWDSVKELMVGTMMSWWPSHALDLDLSIAHRHFGHLCDKRVERLMHGDVLRNAGAPRLVPARLVGRELEHAGCARTLAEQREAEREWVAARRGGKLIDHRFHHVSGVRV